MVILIYDFEHLTGLQAVQPDYKWAWVTRKQAGMHRRKLGTCALDGLVPKGQWSITSTCTLKMKQGLQLSTIPFSRMSRMSTSSS